MRVCNQVQSDRLVNALLYGGFVVTGVITTLLAPMLPLLASQLSLSDARVGCLFPAQFIGSKLGNIILSAGLIRRVSFRSILIIGFAVMCAGVGSLSVGLGWPFLLIAVFCYGTGIGITIPATNLWISESNPTARGARLNLLNLAWSIGALICPAALAVFVRFWSLSAFLVTVAALAALVSGCMFCARRLHLTVPRAESHQEEPRPVLISALICMALLFFLYVGVENSIAGWISSLARNTSTNNADWMLAPAFFWGMLLAGRAIAAGVLRRIQEFQLAVAGLVLAACGTILLISSTRLLLIYLGASMAGLGLASVYPIAIASASGVFPPRIATALFFLSGFGGATLPWIVGIISTRAGSLRAGLLVPLAGTLLMVALEYAFRRGSRVLVHEELAHAVNTGA